MNPSSFNDSISDDLSFVSADITLSSHMADAIARPYEAAIDEGQGTDA